jgi:phage terminase small subunit
MCAGTLGYTAALVTPETPAQMARPCNSAPRPPKMLRTDSLKPDRAAVEWDRLVSELGDAHIQVSTAHRAMLSLAATIAADISQAWLVVKAEGAYITNKKTGVVQVHPASKTLNELRRDYIKVLTALGTRAMPAPPPNEGPSLEEFLASND